jgi:cysteine desulfurase family protein
MTERIYLDNAATSWPKPPAVLEALVAFYRDLGGAAGRGAHSASQQSDVLVTTCRQAIAELIRAQVDDQVVFAHNGTDALNLGIHGLLRPGDHVVVSSLEHNSVLRPVAAFAERQGGSYSLVSADERGVVSPANIQAAIGPKTRLVCLTHASNVTGVLQPVAEVGAVCREAGVSFLIDAAQTIGRVPIDVRRLQCDLLAAAGHKGLLGPLGTAFLFVSGRIAQQLQSLRQGGTGTETTAEQQPATYPHRLEAGNLNVGGIAALLAGIHYVKNIGVEAIGRHELALVEQLFAGLEGCPGVELLARKTEPRVAIASLTFAEHDVHDAAAILDSAFGIQARAGLHCAPHALSGGPHHESVATLRLSPGWQTTSEQIQRAVEAIREIAS